MRCYVVQVLISFDIKAQPVVVVVFVLVLFLNVFRYQASLVFKIVWPQNTNYPAIIPLLQLFKHQHFYRISSIVNQQGESTLFFSLQNILNSHTYGQSFMDLKKKLTAQILIEKFFSTYFMEFPCFSIKHVLSLATTKMSMVSH